MEILVAPKLKKFNKIKISFGGGGTRGFALIGAIRAFEEANIKFDYIAGTSIGSIMGAALASRIMRVVGKANMASSFRGDMESISYAGEKVHRLRSAQRALTAEHRRMVCA